MNKRNTATVLWFAMGWTIGAIGALIVGLPTILGAVVGVPFAVAIRRSPIWVPGLRVFVPAGVASLATE